MPKVWHIGGGTSGPTGNAGGDLSGVYPNPTVNNLSHGSGLTAGQIPSLAASIITSGIMAVARLPLATNLAAGIIQRNTSGSGNAITTDDAAGGDLSGSYPSPSVSNLSHGSGLTAGQIPSLAASIITSGIMAVARLPLATNLAAGIIQRNTSGSGNAITTDDAAGHTPSANQVATSETTVSTAYTDLTTSGPSVTLTTGTSVCVDIFSFIQSSGAAGSSLVSVAVSSASTILAVDANSIEWISPSANSGSQFGGRIVLTGLTAGSNTFTLKYRSGSGSNTATFKNRNIAVTRLN